MTHQDPTADAPPVADAALLRLVERLEAAPGFKACEQTQRRLQGLLSSDNTHLAHVAATVHDDVALAARFLRLINAAYYQARGGEKVSSMQRAVAVMGFDAARQLCVSVSLLDQLDDTPEALQLKEDFLRALLASRLARELCTDRRRVEDAGLCAMFQNLGRQLVAAHCPQDALAIRRSVPRGSPGLGALEDVAARRRLGVGYSSLGAHMARLWGWPPALVAAAGVTQPPAPAALPADSLLPWLGWAANELADALLYGDPQDWDTAIARVARPQQTASPVLAPEARAALAATRADLDTLAQALGLPLAQVRRWQPADVLQAPTPSGMTPLAALEDALDQISEALLQPDAREAVPQQALVSLFKALRPRRAVLMLRRDDRQLHVVRVVGAPLQGGGFHWTVDPAEGTDLFARICQRGADTQITHAGRPEVLELLPPAFACAGPTPCFLVMPMQMQGTVQGLMYLDHDQETGFELTPALMRLLRMVRNQALAALR